MERGSQVIWGSLRQSISIETSDKEVPFLPKPGRREEYLHMRVENSCHSELQKKKKY
jgi:hypothetical protein